MTNKQVVDFIRESNKIEGIHREPTEEEIAEYNRFMGLENLLRRDCFKFVSVYQPDARIRDSQGMNVRVGEYRPPKGGPEIVSSLLSLLSQINDDIWSPFDTHHLFESLHPFTDCNGRLGRMIWMWQMRVAPLGFLHHFYYQSLEGGRE